MKKYKCPACGQNSISFIRKILMHGTIKTKCNFCGSILGTTPKWNMILWIPGTLLLITLALELFLSAPQLLLIITFIVSLGYMLIVYMLMPLVVRIENNLFVQITDLGFVRNNLVLYTKENALKAMKILEENNIKLFGIDSLLITSKGIQPFMEYSSDYSSIQNIDEIWDIAREDIDKFSSFNEEFVYELVSKSIN